jgi:PTH1 family peptidyl-tRNA hydrolase
MSLKSRFSAFRDRLPGPRVEEPPTPEEAEAPALRPALVVGLGNPGPEYANTRHNVGARVVALLAKRHGAQLKRNGRVDGAVIDIDGQRLEIASPRAYMNESGPPIAEAVKRLRIDPSRLLVIYDELDLPAGRVRIRLEGGAGGNNGMRSIIASLRTQGFPRVRIGIDRPYDGSTPVRDPDRIAAWVLSPPTKADREALDRAVEQVADAVELAVREGLEVAMNRYNQ